MFTSYLHSIAHPLLFRSSWLFHKHTHQSSRRFKRELYCHHHEPSQFQHYEELYSSILFMPLPHTKEKKEKRKIERGTIQKINEWPSSRKKMSAALTYSVAEWLIKLLPYSEHLSHPGITLHCIDISIISFAWVNSLPHPSPGHYFFQWLACEYFFALELNTYLALLSRFQFCSFFELPKPSSR